MSYSKIDYDYKIKNIVGTSKISTVNSDLDLDALIDDFNKLDIYDIEKLNKQPGIKIIKEYEDPDVIIYQSGNYMIVGANSLDSMEEINEWLLDTMNDFDYLESYEVAKEHFSIENILLMAILSHKINLLELCENGLNKKKTSYDPEQFPAVFYRSDEYPCTFSIFKQGKIISTGSNSLTKGTDSLEDFITNKLQKLLDKKDNVLLEKTEENSGNLTIEDIKRVGESLGLRETDEDEDGETEEEESEDDKD